MGPIRFDFSQVLAKKTTTGPSLPVLHLNTGSRKTMTIQDPAIAALRSPLAGRCRRAAAARLRPPPPPPPRRRRRRAVAHGPPIPGVCVVSDERAVADSAVGKAVIARMQQLPPQVDAELTAEQTAIENDGRDPGRPARHPGADHVRAARRGPEQPHPAPTAQGSSCAAASCEADPAEGAAAHRRRS